MRYYYRVKIQYIFIDPLLVSSDANVVVLYFDCWTCTCNIIFLH